MVENRFPFLDTVLNLPTTDFQIKEVGGKLSIFDSLRKKFLILTPEEWVRQHIIFYLVNHKGYPKTLISLERGLIQHFAKEIRSFGYGQDWPAIFIG